LACKLGMRSIGHKAGSRPVNGLVRLGVRFFNDEDGVTAIEYGLIAGLLSIVILVTVNSIGSTLITTFTAVRDVLQ
jgi:pilus assembly protein Flp/PilA